MFSTCRVWLNSIETGLCLSLCRGPCVSLTRLDLSVQILALIHQFAYRLAFKIGEATDNGEPEDANSKQLGNTGHRQPQLWLSPHAPPASVKFTETFRSLLSTGFFLWSPTEFHTGSVLIELSHSLGWGW